MSHRSFGDFTPPGFYSEQTKTEKTTPQNNPKEDIHKKKKSWGKLFIYSLLAVICVIVIYMFYKKSQHDPKNTDDKSETEHDELVEKVTEEELKSILKGEGINSTDLTKYKILDNFTPEIVNQINPSIISLLFMGKRIYETARKTSSVTLSTTDTMILDYSCSIFEQIMIQRTQGNTNPVQNKPSPPIPPLPTH